MTAEQAAALHEIGQKTLQQIQVETAHTWAYRAWAARSLALEADANGDSKSRARLVHDAVEYEHEAIEHAALSGVPDLIDEVRAIMAGAV